MARCAVGDDERVKGRYGTFGVSDLRGCWKGKMGGRRQQSDYFIVSQIA